VIAIRRLLQSRNDKIVLGATLLSGFCAGLAYHLWFEYEAGLGVALATLGMLATSWFLLMEFRRREADARVQREILDLAGEGFSLHDWRTGAYLEVNDALCRLFGYSRAELLASDPWKLLASADTARARDFVKTIAAKKRGKVDLTFRRRDGTLTHVLVSAVLLPTEPGAPKRVAGFSTDITAQWQAEQDARAAKERAEQASRSKSRFLTSMHHELRTPLNAIIGFSDLLLNRKMTAQVEPKRDEYVRDIRNSGLNLLDLVGNILDMARIEADEFELLDEAIDLAAAVERVARQARTKAEASDIAIEVEAPKDLPELYADLRCLNRMLGNLISNAIKFSPKGGRMAVRLRLERSKELSIAVVDRGPGIDPAVMADIFEPFSAKGGDSRRLGEGPRLGLAVTKRLIEAHGGRIELVSAPERGTTATLYFPPERTALEDIASVGDE
jgi:PAS domain S-box-containing protein